jgi:hypothetical protein
MAMTATCEPPPEHRGVEWHWLRFEGLVSTTLPKRWVRASDGGLWDWGPWCATGENVHRDGWRYVGPARPPKEGE